MSKTFYGQTDVGLKRSSNQDCFYTEGFEDGKIITLVCDGMGGVEGGNIASATVCKVFSENVKKKLLSTGKWSYLELLPKSLAKANKTLFEKAQKTPGLEGMGTTFVCAIYDNGKYYCLSVGDSRIYVFSGKKIKQLSHDHSYVQSLVDSGKITKEEAKTHPNRNIITSAVGTKPEVDADMFVISEVGIDGVLLCSDGLCALVDETELQKVFYNSKTPKDIVEQYIKLAKNAGGDDNITAVVIKKH